MIVTGDLQGVEGEQFEAGHMGTYTITQDPTRDEGLRVLMGPFSHYDADNIDAAVNP
jgi:rhamnose transport system substrate-binding protein